MRSYYSEKLSGERLRKCYEIAPARVQRYLEAEIVFVAGKLRPTDTVLELGCGYGRVALRLAQVAARVVGIDTSSASLALARRIAGPEPRCEFLRMNASALTFEDEAFDAVVCVQNGICAFAVDPENLVRQALRVVRPGGMALFSTYAAGFWSERLRWFETQAAAGLLGEIDYERTRDGTVVCKDGFRAGTFSPEAFRLLASRIHTECTITTVDESSVFCEIVLPTAARRQRAADGAARRHRGAPLGGRSRGTMTR